MTASSAFEAVASRALPEYAGKATHYVHRRTGAEVVAVRAEDDNRVFGISFPTLPEDSTGIAHILEHMVLCGSRRYPLKRPFSTLLSGSLYTFLNAMTMPDRTTYPVASRNRADFRNLMSVYLDAVLNPLLTPDVFRQEAWHLQHDRPDAPVGIGGVVYNEMKGYFGSPQSALVDAARRSLFPDTVYGLGYGGDPARIPDLTHEAIQAFHKRYYHPSNAFAFVWGEDDPAEWLDLIDSRFSEFDRRPDHNETPLQPKFKSPQTRELGYPGTIEPGRRRDGLVTLNWMLDPLKDRHDHLAWALTELALTGSPAAPLRKALRDSDLGEELTGTGLISDQRQPLYSLGLRGVDPAKAGEVEKLMLDTLSDLATDGFAPDVLEAALNTLEFRLRESHAGGRPQGLSAMQRAMTSWRHGGDPLEALSFEDALQALRTAMATSQDPVRDRIRSAFVDNPHRTRVTLYADPEAEARSSAEEAAQVDRHLSGLSDEARQGLVAATAELRTLRGEPDSPEALKTIPVLAREDLPTKVQTFPVAPTTSGPARMLVVDLPDNGIVYVDFALDLYRLPRRLMGLAPIFAQALTETGTASYSPEEFSNAIGLATGGIGAQCWAAPAFGSPEGSARLIASGKALRHKYDDLLALIGEALTTARLDNREAITRIVKARMARLEAQLSASGHGFADLRLRASQGPALAADELMHGLEHRPVLRDLVRRVESDWASVEADLQEIRARLCDPASLVIARGAHGAGSAELDDPLAALVDTIGRAGSKGSVELPSVPQARSEAFAIPTPVNAVGQYADMRAADPDLTAAVAAPMRLLATSWLWSEVRIKGGAYGAMCRYDPITGGASFLSYRDPNLLKTLDAYRGAPDFLRNGVSDEDLHRSLIGAVGESDRQVYPPSQTHVALQRWLIGRSDADRQRDRDALLALDRADFLAAADALEKALASGHLAILGSRAAAEAALAERPGLFELRDLD